MAGVTDIGDADADADVDGMVAMLVDRGRGRDSGSVVGVSTAAAKEGVGSTTGVDVDGICDKLVIEISGALVDVEKVGGGATGWVSSTDILDPGVSCTALVEVVEAAAGTEIEVVTAALPCASDRGMAVHCFPLICVVNCPAGRFPLVDIIDRKATAVAVKNERTGQLSRNIENRGSQAINVSLQP